MTTRSCLIETNSSWSCTTTSSSSSSDSSADAAVELFSELGFTTTEAPLSSTERAITCILQDHKSSSRYVCRVSHMNDSSERILNFGNYWFDKQQSVHGLVPILSPPQVIGTSVVERYAEILFDSGSNVRMDFHSFIVTVPLAEQSYQLQAFGYLYDIAHAISDLHDHGWAHLDLSLENVALSATRAYLIDFESSLPFKLQSRGLIQREDLVVPLKLGFVPPEHRRAKREDHVSLRAYDVWGFGNMVFAVLFGAYLFDADEETCAMQVTYFHRHGFEGVCKVYHPNAHRFLFDKNSSAPWWGSLAQDLLCGIFKPAVLKRDVVTGIRRFADDERYSARQVFQHCFWRSVGCDPHPNRE